MTTLEIAAHVDARGLTCPMPIVRTALALKSLRSGELVEVLATDAGSINDFEAWARTTGNELIESDAHAGIYRFVLRRR